MAENYRIVSQKLEPVINDEGNGFTQQWNVGYMVTHGPAEGTRGEIHVRPSELQPQVVHAAVSKLVDAHNAVAAL
jgi:hypothetical protein